MNTVMDIVTQSEHCNGDPLYYFRLNEKPFALVLLEHLRTQKLIF